MSDTPRAQMVAAELDGTFNLSDRTDAFTDDSNNPHSLAQIRHLPEDVLIMLFEEFVAEERPLPWPDGHYSSQRATGPFVLAAINRDWRDIVLSCPTIWSYFGFPAGREQLSLLELRVERSKDVPIDIFWRSTPLEMDSEAFKCLMRLIELCSRWRDVDISLQSSDTSVNRLGCLTRPMPFLRSFVVQSQITSQDEELAVSDVFCDAPSLKRLFFDHIAEDWKFSDIRPPALTELALWLYNCQAAPLVALLAQVSSTLETLAFYGKSYNPRKSDAHLFVTLPKVTSITAHRPRWLQNIRAPALRHLSFWGASNGHSIIPYISTYRSVQSLGLWGNITGLDSVDVLRVFDAVKCVRIAVPPGSYKIFGGEACFIGKGVLRNIADEEQPLWPALQVLAFGNDGYQGEEIELDFDDLELIARRRGHLGGVADPIEFKPVSSLTQGLRIALTRLNGPS